MGVITVWVQAKTRSIYHTNMGGTSTFLANDINWCIECFPGYLNEYFWKVSSYNWKHFETFTELSWNQKCDWWK